jgi:hypothetical protein
MHLQQTKVESRATGGPQYYFHDVPDSVKDFLRKRGACPVVLQTPYGIAESEFMAVGKDHKLSNGKPVLGKVGHDRIQQASGDQSIGEAIRHWYGLPKNSDFEKITIDVQIQPDPRAKRTEHFILTPVAVRMRNAVRDKTIGRIATPLSFHQDYQSKLWRDQIDFVKSKRTRDAVWAKSQIDRVIAENRDPSAKHILEADLLRTSGALSILGLELSPYLGKGYDCTKSQVQFNDFPRYTCPVEVKKRSRGFRYQEVKYIELPRAMVLCIDHDYPNPPNHIDVVALPTLAEFLG